MWNIFCICEGAVAIEIITYQNKQVNMNLYRDRTLTRPQGHCDVVEM